MSDVEEIGLPCANDHCVKGGIIKEDEPTVTVQGRVYHEECAPTQKQNQSYT